MKIQIELPSGYYFGLSGTTSRDQGTDDHDFYSFETYELNPKPKIYSPNRPFEQELKAAGKEFKMTSEWKDLVKKVEKTTEKLEKEHANSGKNYEDFYAKLLENQFHILEGIDNLESSQKVNNMNAEYFDQLKEEVENLLYFLLTKARD